MNSCRRRVTNKLRSKLVIMEKKKNDDLDLPKKILKFKVGYFQ